MRNCRLTRTARRAGPAAAFAIAWLAGAVLLLGPPASAAEPQLSVAAAALHQYDGGPPVPASFEFFPGDTVFLTFRIAGFGAEERDDEQHFQLAYGIGAADPEGLPLKEEEEGALANQLTRQDVKQEWMPLVRYDVLVPPAAPSGEYAISIRVEDKVSGGKAEKRIRFKVRGRGVESSDTLVLRRFNFYRSETSTQPLSPATYRAGDSVWARFDITGYEFGEKNRFHIDYGIKVLRASGKLLYEQPVAAEEERESFYPERHIMGGLSLNLTPDLSEGEYTVIVTVHDRVGGQTYEEKQVFLVE